MKTLTADEALNGDDGWIANVKYLLDNCPHTVRSNYKGAGENLLESLILTFKSMEYKLKERK